MPFLFIFLIAELNILWWGEINVDFFSSFCLKTLTELNCKKSLKLDLFFQAEVRLKD